MSAASPAAAAALPQRWRAIPAAHPRLLGDRERLRALARERPDAYARMTAIARHGIVDDPQQVDTKRPIDDYDRIRPHNLATSMALVAAIEGDARLAREAIELMFRWYIDQPVRTGHVTFGHDLCDIALVYDLCHEHWTDAERARAHAHIGATRDGNVDEETSPFHNGWWGYKNAGYGMAYLATMHEWSRAPELLADLDRDLTERAHPCLSLSGWGGLFAEGFYVHYWTYEWLFFTEIALLCAGVDLYAEVPEFYRQRAVASMFEMYPGLKERGSRQGIAYGDAGGRRFGLERERDKARACRDILVARFRDDPAHRAVQTYQLATPRCGASENAYKDFLWRDPTVPAGDLARFKLSHLGTGAGQVQARSSWDENATFLSFRCGKRFTAHQHLDVGHFAICRHGELACRTGHYDSFDSDHAVNYYIRSIAHSTVLVHDPAETWTHFTKGFPGVPENDGGQKWPWVGTPFRHNGACLDHVMWHANRALGDTADLVACDDQGEWLYTAGDCTRAYGAKVELFTRQIVFLRPGTFVVFDRVRVADPSFRTTWLLQTAFAPADARELVVVNGRGRLTVQPLLPAKREIAIHHGADLYRYGGKDHPPFRDTGKCGDCRIAITAAEPANEHLFLHVLTADDVEAPAPAPATARVDGGAVEVRVAGAVIRFAAEPFGGTIASGGATRPLRALSADERTPW